MTLVGLRKSNGKTKAGNKYSRRHFACREMVWEWGVHVYLNSKGSPMIMEMNQCEALHSLRTPRSFTASHPVSWILLSCRAPFTRYDMAIHRSIQVCVFCEFSAPHMNVRRNSLWILGIGAPLLSKSFFHQVLHNFQGNSVG